MALVLIRGAGDVGSAVAHRLFSAGHSVVIHDVVRPAHARRGMAFSDALFEDRCTLAGVLGKRVSDLPALPLMARCGRAVPLTDLQFGAALDCIRPQVLVDARMRKREVPESQCALALLTIGLGPNFRAGVNAHRVIETAWGTALGEVIESGASLPLAGEPRPIDGLGRQRFVTAHIDGLFVTTRRIGERVEAGEAIAHIASAATQSAVLTAPISGCLRGLVHTGAVVRAGDKVIEIDPRADPGLVVGLGERPAFIADGVLKAIAKAGLSVSGQPSHD